MNIPLKCSCGKVRGVAHEIEADKTLRSVCYCDDCQSFAHYLNRAKDILDPHGGTDIMPVRPCNLKITQGIEHVSGMRLSDKGMFRWFAECCNTPVGNLQAMTKMPYAGVPTMFIDRDSLGKSIDDAIGPIQYRMQAKFAQSPPPKPFSEGAPLGFILRVIPYALGGIVRREYRPTPFNDFETGKTTRPYDVISDEFRGRLKAHVLKHQ